MIPARHCDEYIEDESTPDCLRRWLSYERLAAILKRPDLHHKSEDKLAEAKRWVEPHLHQYLWTDPEPILFATFDDKRVRCVMASRFGDVGITFDLRRPFGYDKRVAVSELSDFSTEPRP